jgi:hypothetical protein
VDAQVCDIAAIVSIAHAAGALVCVDNSFLTPLYQRPLQLGADISMTSGTKYIGGHGDTTLGMLAVRDPELGKQLYFLQNSEGAGLAPMDCWLALRGLKTVSRELKCVPYLVYVHTRMQLLLAETAVVGLLPYDQCLALSSCWRMVGSGAMESPKLKPLWSRQKTAADRPQHITLQQS